MRKIDYFVITLLLIITGCKQKDTNLIEIGAILPLTGYGAADGQICKEGLDLAIKEINSQQSTYKFKAIYEDNKSSAKDGLMAFKKLRSNGVNYFVGFGGQFLLSFIPETKNQNLILFANGAPNREILSLSNRCFRIYPTAELVTEKKISLLKEKEMKKVGVIYLQNETFSRYAKVFQEAFLQENGIISIMEGFDPDCRDFKNIINKIREDEVDCIYISGAGEGVGVFIHQLFSNPQTEHIPVIGEMSLATSTNIDLIGEIKAPIYVVDNYMDSEFVNAYSESYKRSPNAYAVYAYIIPHLLYYSFEHNNGDISPEINYDYIYKNKFQTAAGSLSFDTITREPLLEMIINTIE
ncbi:MAG: ABC transporter substrate-binding protein [Bacteroidaceae bacterium]|nr:ABC transporter substrate-binding protein [Bacteroidaceae bacterium]